MPSLAEANEVGLSTCEWWTHIRGKHPQGEEAMRPLGLCDCVASCVDDRELADAATYRALLRAFRNEMVEANSPGAIAQQALALIAGEVCENASVHPCLCKLGINGRCSAGPASLLRGVGILRQSVAKEFNKARCQKPASPVEEKKQLATRRHGDNDPESMIVRFLQGLC